jgi:hypothetical protein
VLSGGKVNIYTLAKHAGRSVAQIERFYARHLPLSAELVRNLQTFGDEEEDQSAPPLPFTQPARPGPIVAADAHGIGLIVPAHERPISCLHLRRMT